MRGDFILAFCGRVNNKVKAALGATPRTNTIKSKDISKHSWVGSCRKFSDNLKEDLLYLNDGDATKAKDFITKCTVDDFCNAIKFRLKK